MEGFKTWSWISNSSPVTTTLFYLILAAASVIVVKRLYSSSKRSPGPWGIPIFGYYPFLRKKDFYIHLLELTKKYGDAYLISIFDKRYVHISSIKALREAFQTKADCFAERPLDFSIMNYVLKEGLSFSTGEAWKALRKCLVQGMRELGIGAKEQMKSPLMEAIRTTRTALQDSKSQPVEIIELLATQCTEVTRRLFLGDNISFETAQKLSLAYITAITPVLDKFNIILGDIAKFLVLQWRPGFKEMIKAKKELEIILSQIVEDHKKKLDPENPQDFIDIFLRDKKIRQDKGDPLANYFTDKVLIASLIQLFGDGGLSVGYFISYYLKRLGQMKDVQEEIFQEICREIGTDRLPTYEDRAKLPLLMSVIKEFERTGLFAPAVASLVCTCDTTISGIFVPKGTIAIVNFYAIHHDPEVYNDPDTFNHKRFLPDEKTKRLNEELPILFGLGKRACPGESLVTTEAFMFLIAILQRFEIRLADPEIDLENASKLQDSKIIAIPRTEVH